VAETVDGDAAVEFLVSRLESYGERRSRG
jgi:hypothetical protein